MRNNYSWGLDLDYIVHADKKGAHLSKNWDKKKQHNYFVEYYKKNKAKWKKYRDKIKTKAREILNPITGDQDQYEYEELQKSLSNSENNPYDFKSYKKDKNGNWSYKEFNQRKENAKRVNDNMNTASKHYKNNTLEGRIRNHTTLNSIEDAVDKKIDEITGAKEKRKAHNTKARLRSAVRNQNLNKKYNKTHPESAKRDREVVNYWQKEYSDAMNEYIKTPGGRFSQARRRGKAFLDSLIGKDIYEYNVNDIGDLHEFTEEDSLW